jgi:hypothetical protein
MQLVDFRDQFPEKIPSGTEYDPSLRYLLWLTLHLLQFKIATVLSCRCFSPFHCF